MNTTPNPAPTPVPEGLSTARTQVTAELTRADAKATTLLSLVGVALAGIVALTGRPIPVAAEIAVWCSGAPILAAVLVLLSAIRPRLDNVVPGTWLYAAEHGPARLLTSLTTSDDSTATVIAHDLCTLAVIARTKYRRIKTAVTLVVLGLAVLTVALVLIATGSTS